jgi:hypothetical protein
MGEDHSQTSTILTHVPRVIQKGINGRMLIQVGDDFLCSSTTIKVSCIVMDHISVEGIDESLVVPLIRSVEPRSMNKSRPRRTAWALSGAITDVR